VPSPLLIPVLRWFGRLSYPKLFVITGVLFLVNLVIPDPFPFVDELLLGLGTLLLANRKRRGANAGDGSADGRGRR